MPVQFSIGSVKTTLHNISAVQSITDPRLLSEAIEGAGKYLKARVKENVSLSDHSLQQLADMDHPYARRHGAIKVHKTGSGHLITEPTSLVHSRSRRLAESVKGHKLSQGGYRVRFDLRKAPHARYIVQGTKVMLPRDPIAHTAAHPLVQSEIIRLAVQGFRQVFGGQIAVRFQR